jgi:hypothetical protein
MPSRYLAVCRPADTNLLNRELRELREVGGCFGDYRLAVEIGRVLAHG